MSNLLIPIGIAAAGYMLLKNKKSPTKQTDAVSILWEQALNVKSGNGDQVVINMAQLGQLGRWDLVSMLAEHYKQQKLGTTGNSNALSAYFAAVAPTMKDLGTMEQLATVADGFTVNGQKFLGTSVRQRKAWITSQIGK